MRAQDLSTPDDIAEACLRSPPGSTGKTSLRWPSAPRRLRHGSGCEVEENAMVFLAIEASQPNGATYRLAIGCNMLLLASWFAGIGRLL